MRNYLVIFNFFLIVLISCSKDKIIQEKTKESTIYEIIDNDINYSILSTALRITKLDEVLKSDDVFTLYAPHDIAFMNFLINSGYGSLQEVPESDLKKILLNHLMEGELEYRNFKTGYFKTLAKKNQSDEFLSIYINQVRMRVNINGSSRIIQGNVRGSNGIIHVVNSVIPIPSLSTFIMADPYLYNLSLAFSIDDFDNNFISLLSNSFDDKPAGITLFAPINNAFADFLSKLEVDRLSFIDTPSLLQTLNNHITENSYLLKDLSDNLVISTLRDDLKVKNFDGIKLIDQNNREIDIIYNDIQANNGIIHIIDKVIM